MKHNTYSSNIISQHDSKSERGYGKVWDVVFDTLLEQRSISKVLEIGVGGASSHISWAHLFPLAQIYGVEVSSPVVHQQMKALREYTAKLENGEWRVEQMLNSQQGFLAIQEQPLEIRERIHISWMFDAFDIELVQRYIDIHGNMDIAINDSKHRHYVPVETQHWLPIVGNTGVWFQEEFASTESNGFKPSVWQEIYNENWRLFDFRQISKFQGQCSMLGMYTHNQQILETVDKELDYLQYKA